MNKVSLVSIYYIFSFIIITYITFHTQFNTAFSEDTQRGTDRLIRNIIQDVTELQRQTIIKTGKSRSAIKVDVINKRIDTAISTLDELASFLPK